MWMGRGCWLSTSLCSTFEFMQIGNVKRSRFHHNFDICGVFFHLCSIFRVKQVYKHKAYCVLILNIETKPSQTDIRAKAWLLKAHSCLFCSWSKDDEEKRLKTAILVWFYLPPSNVAIPETNVHLIRFRLQRKIKSCSPPHHTPNTKKNT